MAQLQMFAVRLEPQDRQALARLAQREQSTISDVARTAIRKAIRESDRAPAAQPGGQAAPASP